MQKARLESRVYGRVQGVGFRWFVRETARALALTGYVRNEYDGSVQVVAEGPRGRLEELLAGLRRGPRSAAVNDVTAEWPEPSGEFSDFEVRFDGGRGSR
jgi:acylphosphatase